MKSEFYEKMLQNMYEGIYFVDLEREITFWNKGAEIITGFSAEEVIGTHCYDNILNHVDEYGNKLCISGCPLQKTIDDGQKRDAAVYLHHKQGHRVAVHVRTIPIEENGSIVGAVEIFQDDSEQSGILKDVEKLRELAMTDQLTEIPNRRYVESYLDSKINELKSLGIDFGVAFFDIDHFKKVNDTYGHDAGDEALRMTSRTCKSAIRKSDVVGRWGGEEFIAVFSGIDSSELESVSEKIRMLVENSTVRFAGYEFSVTVSIGATMANEVDSAADIVKRADTLMYNSKSEGRNRVSVG